MVLVGGGLDDGSENAPLAEELAGRFRVYDYARRGRAGSGDTAPYSVEREIEDLEALIGEAGEAVFLHGVSSGGALALEAAAAGLRIGKVSVYEVPYAVADGMAEQWRAYREELDAVLAEGRRGDAVALFMRLAGSPEEAIAEAKRLPVWPRLEGLAHTLAYDAACLGDGRPPASRFAEIDRPVLVATGDSGGDPDMSGLPDDFLALAANAIAACVPHARRVSLPGQPHVADPKAIAPLLTRFFEE
ncbi:alpha/beta fold hydrolase [Nocardiopsis potens]|uniref:alpha/beta fold hydrolase n=1 Tax=Nocardiopsis potens TaxID=1246458 RepID=UPI000348D2AE|nr:alpha/beta fold hydrolase [Nocardiopsis potens]